MAATFIVENGSGLATANSYVAVATATAYFENFGNSSTWSGASEAEQQEALRIATQWVDMSFVKRFKGARSNEDQALQWPRVGCYKLDDRLIPDDEIPTLLEQAICEIALQHLNGETLLSGAQSSPGLVKRTKVKVGSISDETEYVGGQSPETEFPKAEALLNEVLTPEGRVTRA